MKIEQHRFETPRELVPANYSTFGVHWSARDIERYNAIQERINAFHDTTMPVPEYMLRDSFNIVSTYVTKSKYTNQKHKRTNQKRIEATPARSAWARGVRNAAINLLDNLDGLEITEANLLNGAQSWIEYSEGGCGLIYDADIAEAYCNPSELKLCKGGERAPNARESWLDLQARALYQASCLILKNA